AFFIAGFLLLLVPSRQPHDPLDVGLARHAPLFRTAEPVHGLPAELHLSGVRHVAVLGAAGLGRLYAATGDSGRGAEPGLSVFCAYRSGAPAAPAAGISVQHTVPSPRASRPQPALYRSQFWRCADYLGPSVRHLRARTR